MALHFEQVSLAALPANLLAAAAIAPVMWLGMLARGGGADRAGAGAAVQRRSTRRCWRSSSGSPTRWRRRRRRCVPRAARLAGRAGRRVRGARRRRSLGARAALAPRRGRREPVPARPPRARWPLVAAPVVAALALAAALDAGAGRAARAAASSWSRSSTSARATRRCSRRTASPCSSTPGRRTGRSCARLSEAGVERLDALVHHPRAVRPRGRGARGPAARSRPRLVVNGGAGWPTRVQDGLGAATRARRIAAHAGQVLTLGGIRMRLLWPPPPGPGFRPEGDPNQRAVVAHVAGRAPSTCCCPPTPSPTSPPRSSCPQVEALKVAHHGSADEGLPALLERTRPRVRRDRGRPRQHLRPSDAVDAVGAARRRPRLPHRPRRDGPPARAQAARSRVDAATRLAHPCPASSPPTSSTATTTAGSASAARGCARWPRPRAARAASSCSRATRARAEAVAGALSAMTFALGRRFVIADGVERWKEADVAAVAAAMEAHGPGDADRRLLRARGRPRQGARRAAQGGREGRRRGRGRERAQAVAAARLAGQAGRGARPRARPAGGARRSSPRSATASSGSCASSRSSRSSTARARASASRRSQASLRQLGRAQGVDAGRRARRRRREGGHAAAARAAPAGRAAAEPAVPRWSAASATRSRSPRRSPPASRPAQVRRTLRMPSFAADRADRATSPTATSRPTGARSSCWPTSRSRAAAGGGGALERGHRGGARGHRRGSLGTNFSH